MDNADLTVRVLRKQAEALDICSFELVRDDGQPLPAFGAGSHIDVHLPGGMTRQYSLCNAPDGELRHYQIGVLRDAASRGGSVAMHALNEGDTLRISAPKNHFALAHGAERSLLMAGGIGITPLLCMAERLSSIGSPFELHYATRSRERTAFLDRLRGSSFASQVRFHFDDGDASQKLDLEVTLAEPATGTHVYVCGPKGYIDAVLGAAKRLGWADDHVHHEYFGAAPPAQADDAGFEVRLASSGKVVRVAPDQSVVKALASIGVDVPVSCEQGVCGTCLTGVLEGECDHRDLYLTPDEQAANDQFTPCCSRAKSAVLVLDL